MIRSTKPKKPNMLVRRAALKNVISYTEESCRGCLERRILAGIEEGLSGKAAGSFSRRR